MAIAYVDIGVRDSKRHVVLIKYADGGEEIRRVKSLLDLNVKTIFIDALAPRIIPELKTLMNHGIRIFHLKNLRLLKTVRDRNNLEKSDENDARVLSMIPPEEFRECTLDHLKLRELLVKYHKLKRRVRKIQQRDKEVPLDSSREYVMECEGKMEKIEEEAHNMAVETLPLYKDVIGFIGVDKSINVVELLTILDVNRGFEKLRRFTGHFSIPKITKTGRVYNTEPKRYNHRARECLQNIAEHIIIVEMTHQRCGKHVDGRIWCQVYGENRGWKKRVSLKIQKILLRHIRRVVRAQEAQEARSGLTTPGKNPEGLASLLGYTAGGVFSRQAYRK